METERKDPGTGEAGLESFFAAARGPGGRPASMPDALVRRILADAASVATGQPADVLVMPRRPFAALFASLGGWRGLAGMATATVAGIWLGFAAPTTIDSLVSFGPDYSVADFLPSIDLADGG